MNSSTGPHHRFRYSGDPTSDRLPLKNNVDEKLEINTRKTTVKPNCRHRIQDRSQIPDRWLALKTRVSHALRAKGSPALERAWGAVLIFV